MGDPHQGGGGGGLAVCKASILAQSAVLAPRGKIRAPAQQRKIYFDRNDRGLGRRETGREPSFFRQGPKRPSEDLTFLCPKLMYPGPLLSLEPAS